MQREEKKKKNHARRRGHPRPESFDVVEIASGYESVRDERCRSCLYIEPMEYEIEVLFISPINQYERAGTVCKIARLVDHAPGTKSSASGDSLVLLGVTADDLFAFAVVIPPFLSDATAAAAPSEGNSASRACRSFVLSPESRTTTDAGGCFDVAAAAAAEVVTVTDSDPGC